MTNEELFQRLNAGDETVRDEIIVSNRPLVIKIAQKYSKYGRPAYQLDDIISIGTIGLIKAADVYNIHKGVKFSTFAMRCIINEIKMEVRKILRRPIAMSLDVQIDDENHTSAMDLLPDGSAPIEEIMESRSMIALGINALSKLSDRERKAMLITIADDDIKQHEIAKCIGISQSATSRLIKRAQQKLCEACNYNN